MIWCSKTKCLLSFLILLNVFVSRATELISSLWEEILFDFSWLCLFQIYLHHQSAVSSMDVDDEANPLATYSECRDSIGKQSERKKKSHGHQKLRKQSKILEAIASLSAESIDQSVSAILKSNVGSKRGKKSLYLIPSIFLRTRWSFEPAVDERAIVR